MFSFLSIGSFVLTLNHINYESRSCANNLLLENSQAPFVILGFIVFSLLVVWLTAILTKKGNIKTRTILYITLFYVLLLSTCLNLLLKNGVDFDQMHVLNFSKEVAYGNYWGIYKGQYMSAFPYLFGFAIYEMIVIKLLNLESVEQCILILQLLNCIELTITVFFGYKIIEKIYNKRFALISYCILTISFLPIFLYTSFIYNEIISFMFIYIAMYFVLDFFDSSRLISAFISILSISLAVIMRLNSLIMLIAIILVIIYKCIFSSNNHKHIYIYNVCCFDACGCLFIY